MLVIMLVMIMVMMVVMMVVIMMMLMVAMAPSPLQWASGCGYRLLRCTQIMVSQLGRGRSLHGLPDAAIDFSGVHRSQGTQVFSVHGMSH